MRATRATIQAIQGLVFCIAILVGGWPNAAAAQDAAQKPVTFLGTVQTINGNSLSVKNDAGVTMQVTVQDGARLLRVEPGQKSLSSATPLNLTDLQTGDRVMARGAAGADGKSLDAAMLVAIKSADIAQRQQKEQEAWQKGAGGLVKAVDPTAATITVASGAKMVVVHTTPSTIIRRYAPGSVKFDQAVKSTLAEIKPGDQLRARGTRSEDGTSLDADEIVGGSFLNLAGAVQGVNAGSSTLTLIDATTKKPVVVTITPDSDMKKLDPAVAQRIAARLGGAKRPEGAAGPPPAGGQASGGPPAGGPPAGGPPAGGPPAGGGPPGAGGGPGGGGHGPGGGPDIQQILARSPEVKLADLKKGDMIIVVATAGQTPQTATAITIVAGVEPMLLASTSGSQAMLSSAWNLGGGEGGGGGEGPQ